MHRLALLLLVLIVSLSAGCEVKQADLNSQGSDIGIAVHGNWTVEILNADGTVAETMQFQNDLHKEGEAFLAKLLMGSMGGLTLGQPLIEFDISTDGVFSGGLTDAVCKDHVPGPMTHDQTIVNATAATLNLTKLFWGASCVLDDDDVADAFYSGTLTGVNTRIKVAPQVQVVLGPSNAANKTDMPVFTTKQLLAKTVTETQTIKATVEISFGTK